MIIYAKNIDRPLKSYHKVVFFENFISINFKKNKKKYNQKDFVL